jgi:rubrerythrin
VIGKILGGGDLMILDRRQFLFVLSSIVFNPVTFIEAHSKYSETIFALQMAYASEIQAHLNYLSYTEKARLENYPGIAHLFISFATSESLNARNFKQILSALGVQCGEPPKSGVKVSGTRVNLRKALDFELEDIDHRYPQVYEKCKAENHEEAIRNILYAWESEKQHRDLIRMLRSGTGIFFGILSKKIEEVSVQYFVCHVCGSTMVELPTDSCPICNNQASQYKEVEKLK